MPSPLPGACATRGMLTSPPPCQVYEIAQSGVRPQTLTGFRFPHGPVDEDCTFRKEGKPMIFALVTLNPDGLTDTEHADYDLRKKACFVKKWRWCMHMLVTFSTPTVSDHTWAMHLVRVRVSPNPNPITLTLTLALTLTRITAKNISDMCNLPDVLSKVESDKVSKAMYKAILLFNNHVVEMRSQQGPLSHKCLSGWPVPRVACLPHAPPPAWPTCHAWHALRTLRPLPSSCATPGKLLPPAPTLSLTLI